MMDKKEYRNYLRDPRWIKRRNEILTRDKNTCQYCGAQDKYLQVHHRGYYYGRLPWEYKDEELVTLCEDCHEYIHTNVIADDMSTVVGQVYQHAHSDYFNTAIVYDVDYVNRIVYTIECDDGSAYDSIFIYDTKYEDFRSRYSIINCNSENTIYLFEQWFLYVSDHLDKTPWPFRYSYAVIVLMNPYLQYILKNREKYE